MGRLDPILSRLATPASPLAPPTRGLQSPEATRASTGGRALTTPPAAAYETPQYTANDVTTGRTATTRPPVIAPSEGRVSQNPTPPVSPTPAATTPAFNAAEIAAEYNAVEGSIPRTYGMSLPMTDVSVGPDGMISFSIGGSQYKQTQQQMQGMLDLIKAQAANGGKTPSAYGRATNWTVDPTDDPGYVPPTGVAGLGQSLTNPVSSPTVDRNAVPVSRLLPDVHHDETTRGNAAPPTDRPIDTVPREPGNVNPIPSPTGRGTIPPSANTSAMDSRINALLDKLGSMSYDQPYADLMAGKLNERLQGSSALAREELANRLASMGVSGGAAQSQLRGVDQALALGKSQGMGQIYGNAMDKAYADRQAALTGALGMRGQDISQTTSAAQRALEEKLGMGRLDLDTLLGKGQLALDEKLGTGQLALNEKLGTGRLNLDTLLGTTGQAIDLQALAQTGQLTTQQQQLEALISLLGIDKSANADNINTLLQLVSLIYGSPTGGE